MTAELFDDIDAALRDDIRRLGTQLGNTLVRQVGPDLLERVEQVRGIARGLRRDTDSGPELIEFLRDIDLVDAIGLVRAFTVYFQSRTSTRARRPAATALRTPS